MKRIESSEIIFKIVAYVFLIIFAIFCLYPFIYSISAAISGRVAFENGEVILFPVDIQFEAFSQVLNNRLFWASYANTLFVTFFGTLWAVGTSIFGAYALSKKRLAFRSTFSFFFVFTLWFSAGLVPQLQNYTGTRNILDSLFGFFGMARDDKWLVVLAMGMAAFNVILLRNAFEGVPHEIEEAAIVDGANDFQLLSKIYIPMTKPTIATVTLFFAISRWNGYFWASQMIRNPWEKPLQVYIKDTLKEILSGEGLPINSVFSPNSVVYAMIVCAIIPIIIVYPYIQKYFAKGVNLGGVKE